MTGLRRRAAGRVTRYVGRLRFPQLFLLTAAVFLADLLFPDAIPLVDEIFLGLVTLMLGRWRERRSSSDLPPGGTGPDSDVREP